jgi:hypothetical protein
LRIYVLRSGDIALEVLEESYDLQFAGDIVWHPEIVDHVPTTEGESL